MKKKKKEKEINIKIKAIQDKENTLGKIQSKY